MPTIQNKLHLVKLLTTILLLFSFTILFSCKKLEVNEPPSENVTSAANTTTSECDVTVCEDCLFQETIENDTTQYATVLGGAYSNPYSVANMTRAYNNIHGTNLPSLGTTHYYVRFKPQTIAHLITLDSLDLELYDYPLDRIAIQDGDYWPEAYTNLGQNEYPWLYTVVESNFQFPNGIPYENLAPLNIPNDDAALEDEAFRLTGNNGCGADIATAAAPTTNTNENASGSRKSPNRYEECDPGYHWDPILRRCVRDDPPPPPPTYLHPKGMITFKTYVSGPGGRIAAVAPLKYVRVVGKRFFKIDKTYTDQNGNFQFQQRFPKKVTIVVKFKTSSDQKSHSVREKFSEFGAWKSWFPLRKNIGTYKGNNLQNLNYEFQKGNTSIKRKTRLWIGAVTLNTAVEGNLFLTQNNLSPLPNSLRIYLAETRTQGEVPQFDFLRRSSTPLISQDQILLADILQYGVTSTFAVLTAILIFTAPEFAIPAAIATLAASPQNPDILIHYRTSDINSLTATKVSVSVGQQLGLAYVWKLERSSIISGDIDLMYRESVGYVKPRYTYDDYSPFGNGIDNNVNYHADIVAIRQAFAQHFAHFLSDRIYGTSAETFELQAKTWTSDLSTSSNLKFIEEFNPKIFPPADYFHWIPVGIINDLMDTNNESSPVIDNVSGFTFHDIQTALFNKPTTMEQFKSLLKGISLNQSIQIDQLFASYGY